MAEEAMTKVFLRRLQDGKLTPRESLDGSSSTNGIRIGFHGDLKLILMGSIELNGDLLNLNDDSRGILW